MAKDNRPLDSMCRLRLLQQGLQWTSGPGYENRLQGSCHGMTTGRRTWSKSARRQASSGDLRVSDRRIRTTPHPNLAGVATASVHYGQKPVTFMLRFWGAVCRLDPPPMETRGCWCGPKHQKWGHCWTLFHPRIRFVQPGLAMFERSCPGQSAVTANRGGEKTPRCRPAIDGLGRLASQFGDAASVRCDVTLVPMSRFHQRRGIDASGKILGNVSRGAYRTIVSAGLCVTLSASFACDTDESSNTSEPANVLFIAVDDLNVALGTYGEHPTANTPNIDRLASQGVRFDRAYAQDPLCNPSRTSFLSGRRPASTDVYGNFTEPRHHMGDVAMLPEYSRANGYFTARVGKIAHGRYEGSVEWDISENAARREHYLPGVDRSEVRDNSWIDGADDGLSLAEILGHLGRPTGMPLTWRATDETEAETPDGQTTRRVIELMAEDREKPFFIGAGFHKPHQPWVAPASFFEQHPIANVSLPIEPPDDRDDIPKAAVGGYPEDPDHTDEQKRQAIAAYHATVTLIDVQVGLLLEALSELGFEESAIVVFVSDHGFHLGEHGGLWRKHTLFEESTRVPLIVRVPGGIPGASTMALVELVDLCGLPESDGLEGTSLSSLLRDLGTPWKSAVFSEAQRNGAHGRSVRTARCRYTEWIPMNGAPSTNSMIWKPIRRSIRIWLTRPSTARYRPVFPRSFRPVGGMRNRVPFGSLSKVSKRLCLSRI